MKIIKYILVLFCIISTTAACDYNWLDKSENRRKTISFDVDSKSNPLPNIAIKRIIKLEVSDSAMIGDVNKAQFYKDRIFLFDHYITKTLYVFDESGRFINKTRLGKGPGEVIFPVAFAIDKINDHVLVHDQILHSIVKYDLDLKYINKEKHEGVLIRDFLKLNNDTVLVRHREPKRKLPEGWEYYAYSLYTENFNQKKSFDIILRSDQNPVSIGNPIYFEKDIFFISTYNYNIYQLKANEIQNPYYLDFGKYSFSDKELLTLSSQELKKIANNKLRVIHLENLIVNDNFLIVSTFFNRHVHIYMYSFLDNISYNLDGCIQKNLMPRCDLWGTVNENTLFCTVDPQHLIVFSEQSNTLSDIEISESDNPYIMFLKIL